MFVSFQHPKPYLLVYVYDEFFIQYLLTISHNIVNTLVDRPLDFNVWCHCQLSFLTPTEYQYLGVAFHDNS